MANVVLHEALSSTCSNKLVEDSDERFEKKEVRFILDFFGAQKLFMPTQEHIS